MSKNESNTYSGIIQNFQILVNPNLYKKLTFAIYDGCMGKNILVVDDDTDILEGLRMFLEVEGFNVDTSNTGEKAELLGNGSNLPDLVMLDVVLSGKDGREICKKLKSQEVTKKIPVLLMSAHPSMYLSIKDCLADEFIEKPFDTDFLIRKVNKHLLN